MKQQKQINFKSLMIDECIINFYNKLNEINSNKNYPYNLLKIEEDGFIPTYKNIELKLVDPKLFLLNNNNKRGGILHTNDKYMNNNGKINIILF